MTIDGFWRLVGEGPPLRDIKAAFASMESVDEFDSEKGDKVQMKAKSVITVVLLLFVLASVAYLVAKEFSGPSHTVAPESGTQLTAPPVNAPPAQVADSAVVVYYFYGNVRCPTCRKFESYSDELIRQEFSKEVNDGRLQWLLINVDEPENKHFVGDYKLYTKSIVVVKNEPGKEPQWKNLDKIWQLVGDKQAFVGYVKEEINAYLRAE
jgi:hypothetical protein